MTETADHTRRRRVLVLGAHATSGPSMHRYTQLVSKAWLEAGWSPVVLRPTAAISSQVRSGRKWLAYLEKFILSVPAIRRGSSQAELIHVPDHSDALWLLLLPRRLKTLVTCHDLIAVRAARGEIPEHRPRLSGRLYQRFVVAGLKRASACLAVSEATAADVRRIVGVDCSVLSNPLDGRLADAEVKPEFLINDEQPFALVVSSTGWRKRRYVAVEAWARLSETPQFHNLGLVVVGPPTDARERAALERLSLERRRQVRYLERVPDEELSVLYRRCSVLLHLSAYEGFGWPMVEALAHGRPVLATDTEIHREVAGEGAIYVDVSELDNLDRRGWEKVAESLQLLRPDRAAVRQRFSWGTFYNELGALGTRAAATRILYLVSHPIQYQSPMLQALSQADDLRLHVLYGRPGSASAQFDPGFGRAVVWDLPLTEGHSHEFLRPLRGNAALSRFTPYSLGLFNAARRFGPDVVWLHGYDHINAVRLLLWSKIHRRPVLVRADVEESDAHGGPVVRRLKDLVLRTYFPAIDGFLAVGIRNARFYRDRGVPGDRIHRTPYGVDNARFAQAVDDGTVRPTLAERYKIQNPGAAIFLFSGKLIPRKRPDDAVTAIYRLREHHGLDASLLLVGSGELAPALEKLIERLDLSDRVVLCGFVNQREIAEIYADADVLLLTSARERWGLVANEAMASGCPVISYHDVGCSEDLVLDGVTGKVVPTGDVDALTSAMAQMCAPETRERLSAGARQHVGKYSYLEVEQGLRRALAAVR